VSTKGFAPSGNYGKSRKDETRTIKEEFSFAHSDPTKLTSLERFYQKHAKRLVICLSLFALDFSVVPLPKNVGMDSEIALWPNTRVVKYKYYVPQQRNESNDKVHWYSRLQIGWHRNLRLFLKFSPRRTRIIICTVYYIELIVNPNPMGRILVRCKSLWNNLEILFYLICNRLYNISITFIS